VVAERFLSFRPRASKYTTKALERRKTGWIPEGWTVVPQCRIHVLLLLLGLSLHLPSSPTRTHRTLTHRVHCPGRPRRPALTMTHRTYLTGPANPCLQVATRRWRREGRLKMATGLRRAACVDHRGWEHRCPFGSAQQMPRRTRSLRMLSNSIVAPPPGQSSPQVRSWHRHGLVQRPCHGHIH
jgi:hypothetical protein